MDRSGLNQRLSRLLEVANGPRDRIQSPWSSAVRMLGIAAYKFDRGEKRVDYLAKQHEMHSARQFIDRPALFVRKRVEFHYITKVHAENFSPHRRAGASPPSRPRDKLSLSWHQVATAQSALVTFARSGIKLSGSPFLSIDVSLRTRFS